MLIRKSEGWPFAGPPTVPFEINIDIPQAQGLLAWWPLLGNGTHLHGFSNFRRRLTSVGNLVISGTDFGQNPRWTGNGQYFDNTNAGDLSIVAGEFTISVWAYLDQADGTGEERAIFMNAGSDASGVEKQFGGSTYVFKNNYAVVDFTTPIKFRQWQHITVKAKSDSFERWAYLDGVLVAYSTSFFSSGNGHTLDRIGARGNDTNKTWRGWMFDMRYYNRLLSDAEVYQLYDPQTRFDLFLPVEPRFVVVIPAPGGPADLNVSVSDAITITEAVTATVSAPQVSATDAVSVADAPTLAVSAPQVSASDSISLADSPTASIISAGDLAVSVTDAITITDSPSALQVHLVSVTDAVSIADSPNAALAHQISVTDAITVADSPNAALAHQVSVTDAITIADSPSALQVHLVSVTDAITIADSPAALQVHLVSVTDAITIAESVTGDVSDPQVVVTTAITLSESVSLTVSTAGTVSVSESISITETVTATVSDPQISVSEAITIADSPAALLVSLVEVTDAITIADSPTVSVVAAGTVTVNVTDAISVADSPTLVVADPQVSVSTAITIADSPTVSVIAAGTLAVSVTDAVSITDSPTLDPLLILVAVLETVAISESISARTQDLTVHSRKAAFMRFRDRRTNMRFRDKRSLGYE